MINRIGKSTMTAPRLVWGHTTKTETSVQGDIGQKKDHIHVLELRAMFLALNTLCGKESKTHVQLFCDNTSSCAYLRFFEKKIYLNVLATDIWNWCIYCNIHRTFLMCQDFLKWRQRNFLGA